MQLQEQPLPTLPPGLAPGAARDGMDALRRIQQVGDQVVLPDERAARLHGALDGEVEDLRALPLQRIAGGRRPILLRHRQPRRQRLLPLLVLALVLEA